MRPGTFDPAARYTVLGEAGRWRYVGQAWFRDDEGRRVEHDYVRMVRRDTATGETREVWVDPADVTLAVAPRVAWSAAG